MARTRDVVIGSIIVVAFLFALAFFAFMIFAVAGGGGQFELAGLGGNIGVLEVFGVLSEDMGRPLIEQLDRWAESGSIEAVVLHINSPGGGVAISQEIYDAILRVKQSKPVVVSMASVAASGGYYIACPADLIVANPGTLTGSIGVIMQFYTMEELYDKIGLKQATIKSGEFKDVGSKDLSDNEELMLRSVVMDSHEQFIEAISQGRGIEPDEVRPLADGSLFTGHQAYNLGLVDTLGGLNDAIDMAASLADVDGEPTVVRPVERKKVSIFDLLGGVLGRITGQSTADANLPQLLYLYR